MNNAIKTLIGRFAPYIGKQGWALRVLTGLMIFGFSGCTKDYLAVKREKSQAVPTTLTQFQAILDYSHNFTCGPASPIMASDDMYMNDDVLLGSTDAIRANYTWGADVFNEDHRNAWSLLYTGAFYANVVLDGLKAMHADTSDKATFNDEKGQALFLRAYLFYDVAQVFAKTYDPKSAGQDPGIALRLTSDLNAATTRATVQQTYDQILKDLTTSVDLLPLRPVYKSRASKPAALGMLARTYLVMGDYEKALDNAEECLALYDSLMNYNTLDASLPHPFSMFNKETIYFFTLGAAGSFLPPKARVDSVLYKMYQDNDLRKSLFFKPIDASAMGFCGQYSGVQEHFGGIATDEIVLIAAECYARLGEKDQALDALNGLLKTRFKQGTFQPLTAVDADHALDLILKERRKELLFRGLRWTDLRRLNLDPQRAVTITRLVNGQKYVLKPLDPRYVFQIPVEVIALSGISQNPR